jgi:hypothetical protein
MEIEPLPDLNTEEIAVVASALTRHRRKRRRWRWLRNLFRGKQTTSYKYYIEVPPLPEPPQRVLSPSGILEIKNKFEQRRLPNTDKVHIPTH